MIGNIHSPVFLSLYPMRRIFPWDWNLHVVWSQMTVHSLSQNCLMEMSDECSSPGTMCASVSLLDIHGMSNLHVCVE